jgi:hypothetical protein
MKQIYSRLQLIEAAVAAQIDLPSDMSVVDWDTFARWELLCAIHLDKPLVSDKAHFKNAQIIAKLTDDQASEITDKNLKKLGCLI